MPRPNYSYEAQNRAKCLLGALLMYANNELEDYVCPQTRFKWQNETQLVYETKLRFLGELIAKASQSRRLNKEQIREALRRLEDFLDVLEDNRAVTKGSEDWHFTLNLWHGQHQKEVNLRRFDEEWESRRPKKSRQITNQVESMNIITTYNPILDHEKDIKGAKEKPIPTHLWQLVLNIPFDELTPLRMAEILEVVQKISGDASLTVRKIEEGSVKIVLEGSLEGFRRINSLFRERQLIEIAGSPIKDVLLEGSLESSRRTNPSFRERQLTEIAGSPIKDVPQPDDFLIAISEDFVNLVDGIIILSEQNEITYINTSAQYICACLSKGDSKSLPEEIQRVYEAFIENRELYGPRSIMFESEVATPEIRLRLRARWVTAGVGQRPSILLRLEDLEGVATAEAQEWKLTPRETEVWLLNRSGHRSQEIASQLGITINTVKKHLKNIYVKRHSIDLLLHEEIPDGVTTQG